MKKLFSMIVALATTLSIYAQPEAGTVSLQPMAGGVLSNLVGGDMSAKNKFGFTGGVELGYQVSDAVAVSFGAMYSLQGAKAAENSIIALYDKDYKINISYLNIPVLFNYYLFKGFALKAGVQPAIKLSASENYMEHTSSVDDVKGFDLSIPVGVSYEVSNLVFDFRYNIGVTETVKESKLKNSVFQLTLGYKINL